MSAPDRFAVVAIPLRRPSIVDFLDARGPEPRGTRLHILSQRPTRSAQRTWTRRLRGQSTVTVDDLVALADPHTYVVPTHTDRLVPEQFLQEPGFLTRNLGGWSPLYFAVAGLPDPLPDDPLLNEMDVLRTYGNAIEAIGADPAHVEARLSDEMEGNAEHAAASVVRLDALHDTYAGDPDAHVRALHAALQGTTQITTADGRPVPSVLLEEALMDRLVAVEQERRAAHARRDTETKNQHQRLLDRWQDDLGLRLILKGEYIAGRHRRSTIVIAEGLDRVIKQPAPEPRHEIELEARTVGGEPENWPRLVDGGAVVMPQGRVRRILDEGVVPRLHRAFDHGVRFSALLGLIVEAYVDGPTVQEWVQDDPSRMTSELYEQIAATQHVCERLGVDNPDWHSANFIVENADEDDPPSLVHIDWGAARPLESDEKTEAQRRERLDQVQNLAFSFHDDAIAERVRALHDELMADDEAQARVRRRAEALLDRNG